MFQIRFAKLVHRVFHPYNTMLLLMFAGLAGCQQLQVPVAQKTDSSNISWKGLTIQRDNLPSSTTPNENIADDAVELNVPDSTMIPESDVPVMTVAPQDLDPQLFLGQSPDELKNRLGAPSILRKEGTVEIWQYQLSDCVVDFFFYDKAGTLAATHTDMRSPFLGGQLDQAACRHALYKINQ